MIEMISTFPAKNTSTKQLSGKRDKEKERKRESEKEKG